MVTFGQTPVSRFQFSTTQSQPQKKRKRKLHRLRTIWKKQLLPQMIALGRAETTLASYRTHVKAWERYWLEKMEAKSKGASLLQNEAPFLPEKIKIADPPVQRIKATHLLQFQNWLIGLGKAPGTVRNYLNSIKAILKASPIREIPKLETKLAKVPNKKIYLPVEHIDSIYKASAVASWPMREKIGGRIVGELPFQPVDYWRAMIVLYFNYGFRTQELVSYEKQKLPLTWSNIVFQRESPGTSDAVSDYGWLHYTPQKQRGSKPEPLVLALNEMAAEHLRSIRPSSFRQTDPIFPFSSSKRSLRSTWERIIRKGKVSPKVALSGTGENYQIKHLRKTCATYHNRNMRGIAPYILGHGSRTSVTDLHYDNPELATLDALLSLPQPESFQQVKRRNQMTLF